MPEKTHANRSSWNISLHVVHDVLHVVCFPFLQWIFMPLFWLYWHVAAWTVAHTLAVVQHQAISETAGLIAATAICLLQSKSECVVFCLFFFKPTLQTCSVVIGSSLWSKQEKIGFVWILASFAESKVTVKVRSNCVSVGVIVYFNYLYLQWYNQQVGSL